MVARRPQAISLHGHVEFNKNGLCIHAFRRQLMETGMCLIVFSLWFRVKRKFNSIPSGERNERMARERERKR